MPPKSKSSTHRDTLSKNGKKLGRPRLYPKGEQRVHVSVAKAVHKRLVLAAKRKDQTLSDFVRQVLERAVKPAPKVKAVA